MLAAFIKERHNYIDTVCLACCSGNNSFKILEMVVRRHMVLVSAYSIRFTVIGHINHNIKVSATNGFFNITFTFTGSETGTGCIDNISILLVIFKYNILFVFMFTLFTPVYNILVDSLSKLCTARVNNNSKLTYRNGCKFAIIWSHVFYSFNHIIIIM